MRAWGIARNTFVFSALSALAAFGPVPHCQAQAPGVVPTPEEQARVLQEQVVTQIRLRLAVADALLLQGQKAQAEAAYRRALALEPDFAGLDAKKSDLAERADAVQEQMFQAQNQAGGLHVPATDDLAAQKVALDGQLRATQTLLDLKPAFAQAHAALAGLRRQDGAAAESLVQYAAAIRLNPALEKTLRSAVVQAHLAEADRLAKLGRPEAAQEYREAIRLAPADESARFGLGGALLAQGKAKEATDALREAVRLNPADAEAALTLGLALYQNGRREEARQQWRRFAGSGDAAVAAQAQGMLGRYLLQPPPPGLPPGGPKDGEVQRYREQVRDYPNEAFSHNNLALALHNAGEADEALSEVKRALSLDPDSVQAHTNLGLILADGDHGDAAMQEYKQALKLDSDNGAVHNNLGVVYFNRQQWKQADSEFRKALQGDHSDPYAHHNLADTLLQEGRLGESIRECDKTLQYDPSFLAAYGTRGLVEDKMGEPDKGLADLRLAVRSAPDPGAALLDLADPLRQFAGGALAARQFGALLRQYPDTAEGEEALGRLLLAAGSDSEAAGAFGASIRLKPDRVSAHLALARTLLRLSRLADAAAEARAALAMEPGSAQARDTLGLALYQSGQTQEGRRQWEAALRLDDKDAARNAAGFLREFP